MRFTNRFATMKRKIVAGILCTSMVISLNATSGLGLVSAGEASTAATAGDAMVKKVEKGLAGAATETDADILYIPSDKQVNFAVVEEARFDTPVSDKYVVIDLGEEGDSLEEAQVSLYNETTGEEIWVDADTVLGTSLLFYVSFPDETYTGCYRVAAVRYKEGDIYYEKNLMEDEVAPRFGVNTDIDQEPDLWLEDKDINANGDGLVSEGADSSEYEDVFSEVPLSEDEILDLSDEVDNATVIGIDGENGSVDLSDFSDDSAKIDSTVDTTNPFSNNTDYAKYDSYQEAIDQTVQDTVNKITKSVNESQLLSSSVNNLVFSKAPANVVVVLDPGHGGADTGATYTWDGVVYCERDMNQTIANAVKAELSKNNKITVYMTRTTATEALHGSVGDDLSWRCEYAHQMDADLFVSLHCNSSASVNARKGAEVYIPNSSLYTQAYNVGKTVGTAIGKKLAALGLSNGGTYIRSSENGTTYDDGSISDYYAVIRGCKKYGIPGMIVEHGYVNNREDCQKFFRTNEKLAELGKADAEAIISNLGLLEQNRVSNDMKTTGWRKSGNSYIYYKEDGSVAVGFFNAGGNRYYGKSNGEIVYGWQLIEGNWYYFDDKGHLKVNLWTKNGKGEWIYLKDDGKMATGVVQVNGTYYLFNSDGAMLTGWQKLGNTWYYMNSSGSMYRNQWVSSSGKWYFMGADGKMATGIINDGGTKYYMYGDGTMATGWISAGKDWYYAASSGALSVNNWSKVSGEWYYFGADGKMKTGFQTIGGLGYYLWSSGEMLTGWMNQNNVWYYANTSGALCKKGWAKTGGEWYFFDADGKMLTGLQKDGNTYYYLDSSGAMKTGWIKVGNDWYHSNSSGALTAGNWEKVDGKWYYFDSDAKMATNLRIIDDKTYYFYPSGDLAYSVQNQKSQTSQNVNTNANGEVTNTKLHTVMGGSSHSVTDLVYRFNRENKAYPTTVMAAGGAADITAFCKIIVEEANAEGVNSDLVFAQIMHETGWLQFGGSVKNTQYNFCGLGATSSTDPGLSFKDVRTGVRAQVQHLKAYGSKDKLKNECVDPRFKYVERGCALYVEYLGQQENPQHKGWATNKGYGTYLMNIIYSIP